MLMDFADMLLGFAAILSTAAEERAFHITLIRQKHSKLAHRYTLQKN